MTPVIRALLIITIVVFMLQLFLERLAGIRLVPLLGLSLDGLLAGMVWQLATYTLLHGGTLHILLNMLYLFFFGPEVERTVGARRCALYYLLFALIAGLGWIAISARPGAVCIGASGAVYGIMGLFAGLYPRRNVQLLVLFVLPVTMSARMLVLVLGGIAFVALLAASGSIAHAAHLSGGVAGYLCGVHHRRIADGFPPLWSVRVWRQQLRRGRFTLIDPAEALPPEPAEVDAVLDKISREGFGSLTARERALLDRAARR